MTLADRDALLVQLREPIGAVADVPTVAAVGELTLHDALHPDVCDYATAQAASRALAERIRPRLVRPQRRPPKRCGLPPQPGLRQHRVCQQPASRRQQ